MSIGTESVVKQIVLSPSAFGPNEIVQIVGAIGKSYSQLPRAARRRRTSWKSSRTAARRRPPGWASACTCSAATATRSKRSPTATAAR